MRISNIDKNALHLSTQLRWTGRCRFPAHRVHHGSRRQAAQPRGCGHVREYRPIEGLLFGSI